MTWLREMNECRQTLSWQFPYYIDDPAYPGRKNNWRKSAFVAVLNNIDVFQLCSAFYWRNTKQGFEYWHARAYGEVALSDFDREQLIVWMGILDEDR